MELKLVSGQTVLIDDEDFVKIKDYRWMIYKSCRYATANINGKTVGLHRFIMDAEHGQFVDHINGDRNDNRKSNLRFCNHRANTCNRKLNKNSTTGIKGVSLLKNGRYRVKIGDNNERISLGVWETKRDAIIAYNVGAKILFGDFANLNNLPSIDTRPIEDTLHKENEAQAKQIEELKAKLEKTIAEYDKLYNEKQDSLEELIGFAHTILENDGEYTYDGEFCESSDFAFKLEDTASVKELVELMANEIYRREKQDRDKQYDGLPDYIKNEALKANVVELEKERDNWFKTSERYSKALLRCKEQADSARRKSSGHICEAVQACQAISDRVKKALQGSE